MSENLFEGIVSQIDKEHYSFKVGDKWYRTSSKTNGLKLSDLNDGVSVKGDFKKAERDGNTVNWVQNLTWQEPKEHPAPKTQAEYDEANANKQRLIVRQSLISSVCQLYQGNVKLLLDPNGELDLETLVKICRELEVYVYNKADDIPF